MTLERDYEICNAASAGPWEAEPRNDVPPIEALAEALDGKDFELWKLTGPDDHASVALLIEGEPDATYIAHFDPVRVRKLLDVARAFEEMRETHVGDGRGRSVRDELETLRARFARYKAGQKDRDSYDASVVRADVYDHDMAYAIDLVGRALTITAQYEQAILDAALSQRGS